MFPLRVPLHFWQRALVAFTGFTFPFSVGAAFLPRQGVGVVVVAEFTKVIILYAFFAMVGQMELNGELGRMFGLAVTAFVDVVFAHLLTVLNSTVSTITLAKVLD